MESTIQAVKDIWATLMSLGWQPMPIVGAIIAMLAIRSYYEPSVLEVNTPEGVKRMGKIKLLIFLAVFFTSFLLQVGLSKPQQAFDWCLSLGFSIMDTMAGYVISSSSLVRNFLKNSLFKGGSNVSNATINPPPPPTEVKP